MKRFVEGTDRGQARLFPEYLEDWIYGQSGLGDRRLRRQTRPGRGLGSEGMAPEATGDLHIHPR